MASQSIEELDPNFKAETLDVDENGLYWRDARSLTLEGIGWPEESEPYTRFPSRAEGVIPDAVWGLSRHSAGICVRFVSDAPSISAKWELRFESLSMAHMPATGVSGLDLYARDEEAGGQWRWAGVGIPGAMKNEVALVADMPAERREYCLYLPLYNGTLSLEIGVPSGHTLETAPARTNGATVGFYGTSILHGGCASHTGMAYPSIICRRLDCNHYNLGFSGSARSEPEVAALLGEAKVDAWVLDPLPNMTPDEVTERIGPLVKAIRAESPEVPIILVESIVYQNAWLRRDRNMRHLLSNDNLRAVYASLVAEGITGLRLVSAEHLLGHDNEGTVDGVHPTDVGFLRMADTIQPYVQGLIRGL